VNRPIPETMQLEREFEALRQEAETFNQMRDHAERWFRLRLVMGYVTVVLLPSFFLLSAFILFNVDRFSLTVVNAAAAALFVDGLAFVMAVWKIVLNPAVASKLAPVTTMERGGIDPD
jgi:hypothetical protein